MWHAQTDVVVVFVMGGFFNTGHFSRLIGRRQVVVMDGLGKTQHGAKGKHPSGQVHRPQVDMLDGNLFVAMKMSLFVFLYC